MLDPPYKLVVGWVKFAWAEFDLQRTWPWEILRLAFGVDANADPPSSLKNERSFALIRHLTISLTQAPLIFTMGCTKLNLISKAKLMQVNRLYATLLASLFFSAAANSLTAQTITHVPLYTFNGDSDGDFFGGTVSGAGDINGDGMADLIVGASSDDNNGGSSGSATVFSGSDGSVLFNFVGDDRGDFFGNSVSGVEDVNGDGTPDLIIGATGDGNNGFGSGSATVLSGSDGSVLYTFNGDRGPGVGPGDFFGHSVSDAGDVNGDGTPDLIVGTPFDDDNGIHTGSARVLSGSDGSVLHIFNGNDPANGLGVSVSGAGDINHDGKADLIVGAWRDDNGDNRGNARVLSGSDGSVLYNFIGDTTGDNFGDSVSDAGDVNGDGTPDLIVGTKDDDNNGISSGNARVLSGSDGSVLYNFDGDNAGDRFGVSVSGAGDVNGDGRADLIVGASGGALSRGFARVLSGIDGSVLYNFEGDNEGNGATGGDFDDFDQGDGFGISVSGAGDVNGDGLDDFIVGAAFGGANGGGYARVFVSQILGDCNQDGVVNFSDISPFISTLSAGDFLGQADANQDGTINFLDVNPFIELLSLSQNR